MNRLARLAIVPSRGVAVAHAVALSGGLALAAATCVARDAAGLAAVVVLVGLGLAFTRTRVRSGDVLVVADAGQADLVRADGTTESVRAVDGSLRWPGLLVLRLAGSGRRRATTEVVLLERELSRDDGRLLRRWLLAATESGMRRSDAGDRSS